MVQQAIDTFGGLDTIVCNAGIVRDRMIVNMSVDEWDAVIRVHLRGMFCPVRHAVGLLARGAEGGDRPHGAHRDDLVGCRAVRQRVAGQLLAAKAGIATFTLIAAAELARYGVLANTIAPSARSRMTEAALPEMMAKPESGFDAMDPANVSPFVVWLGSGDCDVTGRAFEMSGGDVCVVNGWSRNRGRQGPAAGARRGRRRSCVSSWRKRPTPVPVYGRERAPDPRNAAERPGARGREQ